MGKMWHTVYRLYFPLRKLWTLFFRSLEMLKTLRDILAVLQDMRDESNKQTAALQSIAASVAPGRATNLLLTLGKPQKQ
jgi:hypothetical protein